MLLWQPRIAHGTNQPKRARQHAGGHSGQYFTDGMNLYRFVEWLARSETGMVAILEDCRSLAVLLVTAERLGTNELRPV